MDSNTATISDMSGSPIVNGRLTNRAARFYWADEEPSRAYSVQLAKSSSDAHFEESPLVIASISAGVLGVAIIIIILVGIWIRSRLFSREERRDSEQPNASVTSSMSTLDDAICMEMNTTVLGSMHNVADNCFANPPPATIELENECETNDKSASQPECPAVTENNDCLTVSEK